MPNMEWLANCHKLSLHPSIKTPEGWLSNCAQHPTMLLKAIALHGKWQSWGRNVQRFYKILEANASNKAKKEVEAWVLWLWGISNEQENVTWSARKLKRAKANKYEVRKVEMCTHNREERLSQMPPESSYPFLCKPRWEYTWPSLTFFGASELLIALSMNGPKGVYRTEVPLCLLCYSHSVSDNMLTFLRPQQTC